LDCDVLFTDDNWAKTAVEKLQKAHIVQLFKKGDLSSAEAPFFQQEGQGDSGSGCNLAENGTPQLVAAKEVEGTAVFVSWVCVGSPA
jgi:hypothetical protein